jgi:hypothetical protein
VKLTFGGDARQRSGSGATNVAVRRSSESPACPGGNETSLVCSRSSATLPSIFSSSDRPSSAALRCAYAARSPSSTAPSSFASTFPRSW